MKLFGSSYFAKNYDRSLARLEERCLGERRQQLLAKASGETLEVGAGTGVNAEYYPPDLPYLVLTEPNPAMHKILVERVKSLGRTNIELDRALAEDLYYPDHSFDTVVATLVLCTVPDPLQSLREIARVLKPGGQFLFLEHVRGKTNWVVFRQILMEPISRVMGCGCSMLRDSATTIHRAGFKMQAFEEFLDLGAPVYDQQFIMGRATI